MIETLALALALLLAASFAAVARWAIEARGLDAGKPAGAAPTNRKLLDQKACLQHIADHRSAAVKGGTG
jgi:hypothetical protein